MTNGRSQKMRMPEMMFDSASRAAKPMVRPAMPSDVRSEAVFTPTAPSALTTPSARTTNWRMVRVNSSAVRSTPVRRVTTRVTRSSPFQSR